MYEQKNSSIFSNPRDTMHNNQILGLDDSMVI